MELLNSTKRPINATVPNHKYKVTCYLSVYEVTRYLIKCTLGAPTNVEGAGTQFNYHKRCSNSKEKLYSCKTTYFSREAIHLKIGCSYSFHFC